MRTDKQFYKSIALSALLGTGFAVVGIAQDSTSIVNPETEAPIILSTVPTGGEMNVNIDSSIEITFDSEMDETTINETTLLLHTPSADSMNEEYSEIVDDQINDRLTINDSENSWQDTADTTQQEEINMIDLGKAGQYVILAKNVNNDSTSRITGDVGEGSVADSSNKETNMNDLYSVRQTTSDQNATLQTNQSDTTSTGVTEAIEDMMSAFSEASMQNGDDNTSHKNESFHDTMLISGIHEWSDSLHIESDVTLSGSEDDVWLFKIGSDLVIDENIEITLTDGARADNIYWYVEGEVIIGENAQFEGIILSMNDITLGKGAKLNGRMFSQESITLYGNTVTEPRSMTGQRTSTNR